MSLGLSNRTVNMNAVFLSVCLALRSKVCEFCFECTNIVRVSQCCTHHRDVGRSKVTRFC